MKQAHRAPIIQLEILRPLIVESDIILIWISDRVGRIVWIVQMLHVESHISPPLHEPWPADLEE